MPAKPSGDVALGNDNIKSRIFSVIRNILQTTFFVGIFLITCKTVHFRHKMLHDEQINRIALDVFYVFCALFVLLYAFMSMKLRILNPKPVPVDQWDKASPVMMYLAVLFLVITVAAFVIALWPCFRLTTFVIGTLGFIAVLTIVRWIPF